MLLGDSTNKTLITVTYSGGYIHKRTQLFNGTNLNVTFWTNNDARHKTCTPKYNNIGIY
jgi:hypothetical protein